jgi:hypothetical protein
MLTSLHSCQGRLPTLPSGDTLRGPMDVSPRGEVLVPCRLCSLPACWAAPQRAAEGRSAGVGRLCALPACWEGRRSCRPGAKSCPAVSRRGKVARRCAPRAEWPGGVRPKAHVPCSLTLPSGSTLGGPANVTPRGEEPVLADFALCRHAGMAPQRAAEGRSAGVGRLCSLPACWEGRRACRPGAKSCPAVSPKGKVAPRCAPRAEWPGGVRPKAHVPCSPTLPSGSTLGEPANVSPRGEVPVRADFALCRHAGRAGGRVVQGRRGARTCRGGARWGGKVRRRRAADGRRGAATCSRGAKWQFCVVGVGSPRPYP